jgi:hypothetical protein
MVCGCVKTSKQNLIPPRGCLSWSRKTMSRTVPPCGYLTRRVRERELLGSRPCSAHCPHEGSYCEHSWARIAKILFVGVCVKVVLCDMKSMRLEHELLRLPDSGPQLCTTFQALKDRAQTKRLVVKQKHKRTPPPITPRALNLRALMGNP